MVGNSPVSTMDELPFKIVKMLGLRDEVIARVENLLVAAWTLSSFDRRRESF
jgi:hypothetical protein